MELALFVAVVVGFVALMLCVVAVGPRSTGPVLKGKTVVIHTKKPDDRTIRGILVGQYADRWTLRDAIAVVEGGREVALGGVEHVPVENIAFVQEIG